MPSEPSWSGPQRTRAIAWSVGAVTLAAILAGCIPFGPFWDPFPDDPLIPMPTAAVVFTDGAATLKLSGETVELGRLVGTGTLEPGFGSRAAWTDDAGWYLTVTTFPAALGMPEGAFLTLDRIVYGRHWTLLDPSRCLATASQEDPTALAGTAVCRGLRWADYFQMSPDGMPVEIPGEPAFDADITFEAH